jgi:hypothetical protein
MNKKEKWFWKPQEDITPWELAQAMNAFINVIIIDTFPPEVKRHFYLKKYTENTPMIGFMEYIKEMFGLGMTTNKL